MAICAVTLALKSVVMSILFEVTAPLTPRESGQFIVENADFVKVLPEGIENLVKELVAGILEKRINEANFSQHNLHPKPDDAHVVEWIFVVDTLNFCFWTPKNYTKYKVNGHTGYFALCAAINRALADGFDITNAGYYAHISEEALARIFRSDDGDTKIPLLSERIKCLHEVGKRLNEKWEGRFENVIRASNNSAERLLQLIVQEFPCFRDEANYKGKRVALYKRAQILIGDLWACFQGVGIGRFDDLDKITMFADYRVPQVLVHFGALQYTPELMDVLRKDTIMTNGDPMEVEIRGASIYIVEKLKEAVLAKLKLEHPDITGNNVNSILIDHFLWDYRRQNAEALDIIPFHKVHSVYY